MVRGAHGVRGERCAVPTVDPAKCLESEQLAWRLAEIGPFTPGAAVGVPALAPFAWWQPRDAGAFAGVGRLPGLEHLRLLVVSGAPERGVAAEAQHAAAAGQVRLDAVAHPLCPVLVVPHDHERGEA